MCEILDVGHAKLDAYRASKVKAAGASGTRRRRSGHWPWNT